MWTRHRSATCSAPSSTTGSSRKTGKFTDGRLTICQMVTTHPTICRYTPEALTQHPVDGPLKRHNLPRTDLRASEDPCALYCLSEARLVASLRPKVIDGTTCYRGIRDICIGGVCREIPCDLNMESNAVQDVCGVCRGNGTSCRLKEGTITIQAASRECNFFNSSVQGWALSE